MEFVMQEIDISKAKTDLPSLLDAAINGAEIIITKDDQPLVRISRIEPTAIERVPDIAPAISELDVMAVAADLLNDHLPDRYCAGAPQFDGKNSVWHVPVLLSYPIIGTLGQVGEITVNANADKVLTVTPIEEMKAAGSVLIEQNREKIETSVS
jgi:antitoxin (DNA-binding transcriptional repressor) of toxin-antitoxin stability system